jgi:hypothetical protein
MTMDRPKVVKLAQPGFDVKTTGDENLVFNSNWPLLKIYKSGSYTISNLNNNQTITTHDLGYIPFIWFFSNATIDSWTNVGPFSSAQRSEYQGDLAGGYLNITKDKLQFLTAGGGSAVGSISIFYYIFALDLDVAFKAPIIKVGGQSSVRSQRTVFKIAKPTKDITSARLEDYIIHSQARSPLIHSVTPGNPTADATAAGGYSLTAPHHLGYVPMFFSFGRNNTGIGEDGYIPLYTNSTSLVNTTADSDVVKYLDITSTRKISIVVLKDPITLDYRVDVSV